MRIFCSGIGGIGLSAYASLQKLAGHEVHGSDRMKTALTDDLESQGIVISVNQDGSAIPEACDLLVYSEAIPETAPERVLATERGIPQLSYPAALGTMTKGYKTIAVCGTHGKSSTTGMSARLLLETHKDPSVVVGTKLKELNGRNWRKGASDLFVIEACEYKRSFSFYHPEIILLTNADGDHFDYYKDQDDYRQAFKDFVAVLPEKGVLITHMQDPECRRIAEESGKQVIDADTFPQITLGTPGLHMQQNAQLVLALASHLGIPVQDAHAAVSGYTGSWRRLETKGTYKGTVPVIDDYAHHPVEIRATVQAIRSAYAHKRLVAVFQPHTHDRTLKLYKDFLGAFKGVDLLMVTDVYEARKEFVPHKVRLPQFISEVSRESAVPAGWSGSLFDTRARLESELQDGDVLLVMGAGDVTNLATEMVQ